MTERFFANLPPTPESHFKLYFYGALVQVLEETLQNFDSAGDAFEQFPFLEGYFSELAENGLDGQQISDAPGWWENSVTAWERQHSKVFLPLRALALAAGLDYTALTLLMAINLLEEDARFGPLFEALQQSPGQRRPTFGLLTRWWEAQDGRKLLRHLQQLGLAQIVNPDAPRSEQALQSPALLWDALRGDFPENAAPWLRYHPLPGLPDRAELILPETLLPQLDRLPALLAEGQVQTIVVRGPHHNGRRTLLGAIARQMKRGVLEISQLNRPDDERWKLIGPLATLLQALPVIVPDLAGGETMELPQLNGYDGPLGVVMGGQGGLSGPPTARALTLRLDMPDRVARRRHWQHALGSSAPTALELIVERLRLTGGNIRQVASLARTYASLEGRDEVGLSQVQLASRALNRQQLETLATPLPTTGDWSHLAVGPATLAELANLESRCRYRERMQDIVGPALQGQLNAGIRALFSGPSGTGKTLAARLLAAALQLDLYRLDLSAVVNKYIGETEKNLQQIFARAEELDIILLLDEGDALLTRRTSVQNSNDRYANLETNYLLQRLESYEGILLVTTNASDRIDGAFQRRMDVVVEFHLPELAERRQIWQLHLPPEHQIDSFFLEEVSSRCQLSGGQIRNAVLHAALLALNEAAALTSRHLEAAIWREYRKAGQNCPLRRKPLLAYQQE